MEELIYSKYSNERSRRFAIRTDILEDEDGNRYVEKKPLYPQGQQHVDQILRWSRELEKIYQEASFSCNRCEKTENGIRLEYVQGETLEERLDLLLQNGEAQQAEQELLQYVSEVQKVYDKEPFVVTEDFQKVFGNVLSDETFTCAKVTNIDMVCGNLVLADTNTVLDYEWTFDFPVPCQFVLFRIIHYYVEAHPMRNVMDQKKLYKTFGIDKKQQELFGKMEEQFQAYTTEGHVAMRDMFLKMSKGTEGDLLLAARSRNEELEKEKKELERENVILQAKLEKKEKQLKEMRSTKVWKIYRKYRHIVERKK